MSGQPFTSVTGAAVAVIRKNVDTDMIIRIEKSILPPSSLGPYAFESIRLRADGSEDPACELNQAVFKNAPILLAEDNFGCGSSREAAVWALRGMGIRCVIAPSFGDIFFNNCFQNALLPIRLPMEEVERLHALCKGGAALTVDLTACVISAPDKSKIGFEVDPSQREGLLSGLDEVEMTLKRDAQILSWQSKDKMLRPWIWDAQAARAN